MLLSVQQKYIVGTLRKLGYIRRRQLQALVQGKFPAIDISDRRMEAMLRQLRFATADVRLDGSAVWLGGAKPDLPKPEE